MSFSQPLSAFDPDYDKRTLFLLHIPLACRYLYERTAKVNGVKVYGPSPASAGQRGRAALATFNVEGLHATDLSTLLDASGVAVRSGHHCTQPVHRWGGFDMNKSEPGGEKAHLGWLQAREWPKRREHRTGPVVNLALVHLVVGMMLALCLFLLPPHSHSYFNL